MSKWKLGNAKNALRSATGSVGEAVKTVKETYDQSAVKTAFGGAADKAKIVLDKTGVADAATKISETAGDHLDTVSGVKLLALVEERLETQTRYNDILAEKLQEALDRIATLEKKVGA